MNNVTHFCHKGHIVPEFIEERLDNMCSVCQSKNIKSIIDWKFDGGDVVPHIAVSYEDHYEQFKDMLFAKHPQLIGPKAFIQFAFEFPVYRKIQVPVFEVSKLFKEEDKPVDK